MDILLSIIGSFLVAAIGINGFFLRGIFKDLNDVRVTLAALTANHKATLELGRDNKSRIYINEQEIIKLRERVHGLEGAQLSLAQLIKGDE